MLRIVAKWIHARTLISAVRFMKACPPQVVLAHSQLARIIANVFVVGYEIFKEQMKGKKLSLSPIEKKSPFFNPLFKKFINIFYRLFY